MNQDAFLELLGDVVATQYFVQIVRCLWKRAWAAWSGFFDFLMVRCWTVGFGLFSTSTHSWSAAPTSQSPKLHRPTSELRNWRRGLELARSL